MPTIPAFGLWTERDHQGPKQERAVVSAQSERTTPVSLDPAAKSAVFWGSGKDPYRTSLSSCTCMEFVRFKVPCKHIYRLSMELGIIDLPYKTGVSKGERLASQISFEDAAGILEALSDSAQRQAWSMLSREIAHRHNPHLVTDPAVIAEFRTCPLFAENPFPVAETLNTMEKPVLSAMVAESGIENTLRKNAGKATLISWILENIPNLPELLPPYASFSFISNFDMAQCKMISHFSHKFAWNEGGVFNDPI